MIDLAVRMPERHLDLRLTAPGGEVTAVVGPNGVGKSTLLGLVAGTVTPTEGIVRVGGEVLASSEPRRFTPPHRRPVVLLTQRAALFPHLDVLGNVAFGPRAQGAGRRAAETRAREELAAVGVAGLAGRRPAQLSGGQAQRVALARALATDPTVVLLDEPLTGLDVQVAAEVRSLLETRLRGTTTLLVTHDLADVEELASTLAVLDGGEVVATGPAPEFLAHPPTPFVADLARG